MPRSRGACGRFSAPYRRPPSCSPACGSKPNGTRAGPHQDAGSRCHETGGGFMKTVTSTLLFAAVLLGAPAGSLLAAEKLPAARLLDMYAVREEDTFVVHVLATGDISAFLSDRKSSTGHLSTHAGRAGALARGLEIRCRDTLQQTLPGLADAARRQGLFAHRDRARHGSELRRGPSERFASVRAHPERTRLRAF